MRTSDIDIWYGDTQHMGRAGIVQRWYNVLGRVHRADDLDRLEARLNGGAARALSVGADRRRLVAKGDFNVELDVDELEPGSNRLVLVASYTDGFETMREVEVVRHDGPPAELPLTIDWERDGLVNQHTQIVDGRWEHNGRYVTTRELGYDRLIGIGDVRWRDYDVLVPVVVHAMEARAYGWPSVHTGVGIVMRWKGHSNWGGDRHASGQPRFGPGPYGAIGWWTTWADEGEHLNFFDVDLGVMDRLARHLHLNAPYLLRVRVSTRDDGRSIYRLKAWEESAKEPTEWDVSSISPVNALDSGSLLLGAHETAASFGPVEITPV